MGEAFHLLESTPCHDVRTVRFSYCLVAIVKHDCQLGRTTFQALRVQSRVLTDKTSIRDLFKGSETIEDADDETIQLQFEFKF